MGLRRHRGFVLVATLWIIAIIAIAATYFAERTSRAVAMAFEKQDTAEELRILGNTRAEMLFRLASTLPSFQGVGLQSPIAVDNRPYRGSAGDVIRLQDNLGLVNLNHAPAAVLGRLLGEFGVAPEGRDAMIDALADFIDTDDFKRLNGAEAREYRALGLPPPPNDWLMTPMQAREVIGWREKPQLWDNGSLRELVTSNRIAGFNPNTAPPATLMTLPGMTRESAAAAMRMRAVRPFYDPGDIPGYTPRALDPDYFIFFHAGSIRITQQSRKLLWAVVTSVSLTPWNDETPWCIDYQVRSPVSYPLENEDKIPPLPPWVATLDPEPS